MLWNHFFQTSKCNLSILSASKNRIITYIGASMRVGACHLPNRKAVSIAHLTNGAQESVYWSVYIKGLKDTISSFDTLYDIQTL